MTNPLNQWLPFSLEGAAALRQEVNVFRSNSPVKSIETLSLQAGYKNLRKWLNGNQGHMISEKNYYKIIIVGLRDGWLKTSGIHLYSEISKSLGYPLTDAGLDIVAPPTHHYDVYRYSYIAQGYILRGYLTITYEKYQIKTKEVYRIQSDIVEEKSLGYGDMVFSRSGFMFPMGSRYLMVSQRDNHPNEVKTAYLEVLTGHTRVMRGPFSDRHGNNFYAARMYISPRRGPLEDKEMKALKPEFVNDSIKEYLTYPPTSGKHVISLN